VFAVFTSVNTVLNDFFDTYEYHFSVSPNNPSDTPKAEEVVLREFDGLVSKGDGIGLAIKIEGYDKEYDPATGPPALFADGHDPEAHPYNLKLAEGSGLNADAHEVLISRSIAEAMDKGVGDKITIHAGGRSGDYAIRGIVSYPFDGVWFYWKDMAELAGFVNEQGEPISAGFLVAMPEDDPTADEVEDMVDEVNEVLIQNGISASYGNIELFTESISEGVGVFRLIFNFAALLIALVGAVGLLTTLSMSVFERQKEIGVMRSIGAGSGSIVSQFLTEGLVVGLMAWLVGLPMSYFLSLVLIDSLNLGDEYNLEYPLIAVVIGFVGIMVITTIASIWPSIAAARKTVSDILRYQ
ncbi:MAG: FtsX-like permease family protein, partial [Anaerolineae bacterium]|nr:FtsX-like permease family protein [Anaerolineae bacterium]